MQLAALLWHVVLKGLAVRRGGAALGALLGARRAGRCVDALAPGGVPAPALAHQAEPRCLQAAAAPATAALVAGLAALATAAVLPTAAAVLLARAIWAGRGKG